MNDFIKVIQRLITKAQLVVSSKPPRSEFRRMLLHEEARMGGQLFGPVPTGKVREFYQLTPTCWIWNEGGTSPEKPVVTTRYEIEHDRVIKIQDNRHQRVLYGEELEHFYRAVKTYSNRAQELYSSLN